MNVLIIGKGKSGLSAGRLLEKNGYSVFYYDDREDCEIPEDVSFVIKSPGIPQSHPVVSCFREKNVEILGEVEIASRYMKGKIVGITGTNGKSTTTALVYHVLKKLWKGKVFIGGNFGIPVSEFAPETDKTSISVIELSSYQIEDLKDFKCDVSTILNITPDHLNRYKTFEEYAQAKLKLLKLTKQNVILNADDRLLKDFLKEKNVFTFSMEKSADAFFDGEKIVVRDFSLPVSSLPVRGYHNIQNFMATLLILQSLDINLNEAVNALQDFKGLEHRLEFVKTVNGITFINDSKSTNVDSLEKALLSFDKVILIAGGKDKGIDFSPIKNLVKERVKKAFFLGETGRKLEKLFSNVTETEFKATLEEAVFSAYNAAKSGDIILFSPGCSSFDMFKNFEERGKIFKQIVEELK
ncbi:UDP-N-acetylmuramoyl-L-alanine--D-glutamate ligase [Desulfurobacterium indicum]|uniref:UDP-N-acetylmuramoylalanine--D-glutamate ligase n=1 Tax=Desulfurobacterium indicum TaxID=1914305 RepID=A0A1R1MN69_9BACT|nr:UDP-N-acetylmuramoyl-L-alanine--D-glutamate ligase [Desulfurobacterium indicum]OMH41134.1 UDP-N-acetylmuramoylalanine--D-glutamate ligase [Desulfurobacterium indicum]